MKEKNYTPHIFSLCALLVLGNAVIIMPVYKNGGFLSAFLSVGLSFVLLFLTNLLIKLGSKNKPILYVATALICVAAIYSAIVTFVDYIGFLTLVQMPQTNGVLLSAVWLGVVIFLVVSDVTAIYKYSLFVLVIATIFLMICFIGGIKTFDFTFFKTNFLKINFSLSDFLRCFSSLSVIPLFVSDELKYTPAKAVFGGTATGFLTLILCFTQSVLTLGISNNIAYPYIKAVSVISSGSLFTRLDGLVYFVFFTAALTKITICIKTVMSAISRIKNPPEMA